MFKSKLIREPILLSKS